MEHNVRLVFIFTAVHCIASGILSQQILAVYVYLLASSNQPVGSVRAVQGLSQLLFAFPAGWAADVWRRDLILSCAGVIGILSFLLMGFSIEIGSLELIYVSYGLLGVYYAFQSPTLEAIFADSVPTGKRSFPFTLKHMTLNGALVVGPLASIVLFDLYGNTWEMPVLRAVLLCGTFAATIAAITLFFFDDDQSFENRQYLMAVERELSSIERNFDAEMSECRTESDTGSDRPGPRFGVAYLTSPRSIQHEPSENSFLLASPRSMLSPLYRTEPIDAESVPSQTTQPTCCGLRPHHVPYLLFLGDFIISNGMGLAIHYFPIFFYKEFDLKPTQVTWLFVCQLICTALCSIIAQQVSLRLLRMPVIVLTRFCGAIALFIMASASSIHWQIVMFLIQSSMIQCSEPLRRSIIMDVVPKHHRARWNSLEGLTTFAWTGSAILGGFIVDSYGYRWCFFAAASAFAVGMVLEMLLIPITRHVKEVV